MKKWETVLIAGGDLRQIHIANLMSENSKKVYVYGFDEIHDFKNKIVKIKSLNDIKEKIDVLILPIPAINDDGSVTLSFSEKITDIDEVLDVINQNTYVFAGKVTNLLEYKLKKRNLTYFDYLECEELAVMNAIPTVEGTLQIIMEELPVTIYGLNVYIIGSGRIAKVLRKDLVALGAKVTTVARKYSDLAWSKIDGANSILIKDLDKHIHKAELIVNTVPVKILDEQILNKIKKSTLLIDLASKPGGVDFDEARKLGIHTIWALSLPGKVAPITAGEIIFDTITNIMNCD